MVALPRIAIFLKSQDRLYGRVVSDPVGLAQGS